MNNTELRENTMNLIAACAHSTRARTLFDTQRIDFYREFTEDPAFTTEAQALPQMIGSGLVHDQQMAHLDALVQSWGNTSSMVTSLPSGFISTGGDQRLTAMWQFSQTNPTVYAQIKTLEQFNGQTIMDKWVRPSGDARYFDTSRLQHKSNWKSVTRKCYRLNSCLRNGYGGYRQKTPKNSALRITCIANHYSGTQQ
jgi:hypothetical protein